MDEIQKFVKDRNKAMKAAVMDDDWDAVRRYMKKYQIQAPEKEEVMKAGIYKAVQEITNMPDYVKLTAYRKCIDLGFRPTMR
jgi:hypothetical protein